MINSETISDYVEKNHHKFKENNAIQSDSPERERGRDQIPHFGSPGTKTTP
jgi:hypothetical protein